MEAVCLVCSEPEVLSYEAAVNMVDERTLESVVAADL